MRYPKGFISISETHDLPLLLLLRNSRYITHSQLRQLSGHGHSRTRLTTLLWRMRRLIQGGFVAELAQRLNGQKVYAITDSGLDRLELLGHPLAAVGRGKDSVSEPAKMMHSLDLNDIRIQFTTLGIVAHWMTDIEVCSQNLKLRDVHAKDYDAIAALVPNGRKLVCGIEYERESKSARRYREIRRSLAGEANLDAILYIVREVGSLGAITGELAGAHRAIYFTSLTALKKFGLDAYAMRTTSEGAPLGEYLAQIAPSTGNELAGRTVRSA